ncbi:glycosyltransferase family 2 protein [Amycolatopsis sp. NPDC059657]|uniref:glycosyltransferase family 2 protein n=1 Tax=Amycolatopsis sp. NPDC059657 TaxID=3346899 RepID=UPI0036703FFC
MSSISIAILAKNEERCIARCLDSILGQGFDDVVVVDTGSSDETLNIIAEYEAAELRVLQTPWRGSFSEARNLAIDAIESDWIVFLDADEWLTPHDCGLLRSSLEAAGTDVGASSATVFAPTVYDTAHNTHIKEVPRIFRANSQIRYKGLVHEYPVLRRGGNHQDEKVDIVGVDIEILHDGYDPGVIQAKRKTERNFELLENARAIDPGNPRWLYFTLRNPLSIFTDANLLVQLCESLRILASNAATSDDWTSAHEYYRRGLTLTCQGLGLQGKWHDVAWCCTEIDRIEHDGSADSFYFRTLSKIADDTAKNSDLLAAVKIRQNEEIIQESTICHLGRNIDALIVTLLGKFRSAAEADRYLELCETWSDLFFEKSHLRLRP